ncbi:MAG: YbhB/YbcL family Raf kinase inhibitor-like protein [Candidatus Harrisonbacteria bacterium]|nr:YbhB/YbcL family Raf kinase inhibitor-like protein [Candidatus Harrisonbacteria bacterium]
MNNIEAFSLSSSTFEPGGTIPSKYTCDGDNISPPLRISGDVEDARSLALIMDDPDIPAEAIESLGKNTFDHWVVFNIPTSTTAVAEGADPEGVLGLNDRGELGYTGPCPPDREHRYIFKLYALDTELELHEGAKKSEVLEQMQGHILAETELIGRYERE